MSARLRALAIVVALPLAACSRPPAEPDADTLPLVQSVGGEGVRFRNPTHETVYYAAFERDYAERVRFAPCTDPARCPSVAPRGETMIPFSQIGGYQGGRRLVIVYFWHLVPAAEGYVARDIRSRTVLASS